jgi:zinc protease
MQVQEAPPLPDSLSDDFDVEGQAGGIEAYRLKENDLQVLLLEQAAAPVATFMVTYHVGSRNEHAGRTGATHFLEHLMFKGTERFNERDGTSIFNTLQRVGANVNASTWLDRTNYYELLPKEHLPLAIEIEADRMRGALLREDDLESERSVILNELDRGKNEPMRNLFEAVWASAFTAHPYRHPTIGWRSDVENATQESLQHFYDTFYWPNHATACVIGDFDKEEALGQVSEHFGAVERAPHAIPEVETREPEQRGERRTTVRQAGQLGALMAAYKSPPAMDEDTDALDVLSSILTSGKNSRLFRRLTDQGLTTQLSSAAARLRDPGLFYIFAALAPERSHEEVEEVMFEAIAEIQEDGVSEEEVQRAKNELTAQEKFGRDGSFSVAAQLNEAIAAGDWCLYAEYVDRIRAVSPGDVQRAARQYLTEDQRTVGRYVPT